MSRFRRPIGMKNRDDPEEQYRAGFQHGAQAVRDAIEQGKLDQEVLVRWIEIDLQKWRHDEKADPTPPILGSDR